MRKQHSDSARAGQLRQSSSNRSNNKGRRPAHGNAAVSLSTQAILERLENRQLLSSSVSFSGGVLTLTGDAKADNNLNRGDGLKWQGHRRQFRGQAAESQPQAR